MAKRSHIRFLCKQWATVPPVVHADLRGKTAIVLGANTGIGFEAAQHFARMDVGRLILACRSREKGETAIERLNQATGYSKAELWLVDLGDFASVGAFVDQALRDLERVDLLILNAAAAARMDGLFTATNDGWETSYELFSQSGQQSSSPLLALLMLPRVLETAKRHNTIPRIVVVSSDFHFWTELEDKVLNSPNAFEILGSKEYCTSQIMKARYADSKLLNVFFARALSNRVREQPVIVNVVHPGFCYSELRRDITSLGMRLYEMMFAWTAEQGSRQLIWAAVGTPKGDNDTSNKLKGAYVGMADIDEPSDFVLGDEGKKREDKLWVDLISTLEKVDPRVKDVVAQCLTAP
ncbi:NAD(P)-binding protein [Macrolepiota fuliginosa MF-IS2]|uniref:NAD(P)-binding protein n=1 Tax=Macrolepiota fuliginosa MF-IS2 TaxID=1400762 RepID=A0A9P6C5V5_9AGAR|nr:NAD(P)-binding protein [Macrolepiota fuliginosa MF-IS2]